ncbi:hypothetical protein [Caudoviricetes sp.]|nr:hypothetical protein [Caudoviricetes sp.]
MSMYNMVHGTNPLAGVLLRMLDTKTESIPRFRDCYFDGEYIVIYTRTGGGNRDWYDEPNEDNKEGPWNSDLRALPGFVRDEDDDYDSTYASFYFTVPEQFNYLLDKLKSMAQKETQSERWEASIERIKTASPDDPLIARMTEAFSPIFAAIEKQTGENA